jgi:hypothetical protein
VGVLTVEFFLVGGSCWSTRWPPAPQFGSPQHRQRRLQPVRVAGARPVRSAAAGTGSRFSPPSCSTCSGICGKTARRTGPAPAGTARRAPSPLWQGRSPPRPQDGPCHRHWPRLAGGGRDRHRLRQLLGLPPR